MQQTFINLFQSKTRLMVILRYILFIAIAFMGVERMRLMLVYLQATETYNNRDFLQYYLIAKAIASGANPYLPLDKLAQIFIGNIEYFPHPAPCTPFLATLFLPLTTISLNQFAVILFAIEMIFLVLVALMLPILWTGRISWLPSMTVFIILIAWYTVANDLSYGQLSILLTVLLLVALLALKKKHKILAGVLIGLTVAIKLITWPLLIYFAIKRDWRTLISSILTTLALNLLAAAVIGIGPFTYYYLQVSSQVFAAYQGVMHNWSLWTIGYRLFEGTGSKLFTSFINAPALIYIPKLAPIFSGLLVAAFLIWGLLRATRSIDIDTAMAIMVCMIIGISPVVWEHYFVMLIIPIIILYRNLWERSFPAWEMLFFVVICLFLFLVNEQLGKIIISINGGSNALSANHNRITFTSSLLSWLPILQVIGLSILLWRSRVIEKRGNADSKSEDHLHGFSLKRAD
jgi:hypothetical protein